MLTADELGDKGESRFKELCADAKLLCNKADRDRSGWDFLVEDHFDNETARSLDKRHAPFSCHVQVKTILSSTKSIRMKLNMAERLAKELKPAFVCVFVVSPTKEIIDSYLIHILSERLAHVLQRLRKHSVDHGTEQMNKVFVSMRPQAHEKIATTGDALRQALLTACGDNVHLYSLEKQKQLSSLGFGQRPYVAKIKIPTTSSIELGDIYLGIKTEVPVRSIDVFETRFGIEIQEIRNKQARITITPEPFDSCRLIVRGDSGSPPVSMDAKLYNLPGAVTGGSDRMYVKADHITLDVLRSNTNVNGDFKFEPATFRAPSSNWREYWKLADILFCSSSGSIEIRPKKYPSSIPFSFSPQNPISKKIIKRWLALTDALDSLYQACGEDMEHQYECSEIAAAESQLALVNEILQKPDHKFHLPLEAKHPLFATIKDPLPALMCQRVVVGDMILAYHTIAKLSLGLTESGYECVISDFSFRGGRRIGKSDEELKEYQLSAQQAEKIEFIFGLNLTAKYISED